MAYRCNRCARQTQEAGKNTNDIKILRKPKAARTLTAFFLTSILKTHRCAGEPLSAGLNLEAGKYEWNIGWISNRQSKIRYMANLQSIGAKRHAHGKWQRIAVSQQHEDNRNIFDAKFARVGNSKFKCIQSTHSMEENHAGCGSRQQSQIHRMQGKTTRNPLTLLPPEQLNVGRIPARNCPKMCPKQS